MSEKVIYRIRQIGASEIWLHSRHNNKLALKAGSVAVVGVVSATMTDDLSTKLRKPGGLVKL